MLMENGLRRLALTALAFAANFGLDRVTKAMAQAWLRGGERLSFLGGAMVVVYAENDGAFLGLGSGWPPVLKYGVLLVAPIALCLYGLWYCVARERLAGRIVLLATIAAGGLGNLVDRLLNGFRVVDFLNFGIGRLRTGVLNVADLSITFGALGLVLYEYLLSRKAGAGGK